MGIGVGVVVVVVVAALGRCAGVNLRSWDASIFIDF